MGDHRDNFNSFDCPVCGSFFYVHVSSDRKICWKCSQIKLVQDAKTEVCV